MAMRPLRSGQEAVLSWSNGTVECRVIAAAGAYVLLRPERRFDAFSAPGGSASLTYLDGMIPMGWDGRVEDGAHPGELRFQVTDPDRTADRRSSNRVPIFATAQVSVAGGEAFDGQLLDVSAGGMRFRHSIPLAAGQHIRVRAQLPEEILIDADAVVRKVEPGDASIEFITMHAADRETIGAWTVSVMRASVAGQG
jgi:hypothetical protein